MLAVQAVVAWAISSIHDIRPARALLVGLGVALASASIWGCGGDTNRAEFESTSTPTTTSAVNQTEAQRHLPVAAVSDPRRRAYIARTDQICVALDNDRDSERTRVREAADTEGAVTAYENGTALGETEIRRIEAVPPPPGDVALLRANVFGPVHRQLALRAKIRNALAAVDLPRLQELRAQLDNLSRALSAFGRGYGWHACGEA